MRSPLRCPPGWCLLLAGLLAACSADDPPVSFERLSLGFSPPSLDGLEDLEWGGRPVQVIQSGEGDARYSVELEKSSWHSLDPGTWRASRPFGGLSDPQTSSLTEGEKPLRQHTLPSSRWPQLVALEMEDVSDLARSLLTDVGQRPAYLLAGPWVYLLLKPDAQPPESMVLAEALGLGSGERGSWRVQLGPFSAEGLPVLSGQSATFALDLSPGMLLRFRTVAVGSPGERASFRVTVDGREVFQHDQSFAAEPEPVLHAIPLGQETSRSTLSLEVSGGHAGFTAFITPVLCPPPDSNRPEPALRDVVLLMADTFRADNLAAWDGDPDLCPRLNDLAAKGRRYMSARAPATWTLPSHAAMFSGLYPPQVSVRLFKDRLPEGAWTMAEHFQQAGYRTVAITDGGFVGRSFGFDQGFEWFEEGDVDVPRTLAAVRRELEADDGRPLFLFVHSYRAHEDYKVDPPTRARLADVYPLDRTFEELQKGIAAHYETLSRGTRAEGTILDILSAYERWYRGASADLDRAFGEIVDSLAGHGILADGVVAFTSDHGEGFGEHGVFGHGRGVWDEEAVIPLVLLAPGLEAGEDSAPASLVDLPRTLTSLAGVQAHADWIGRDLTGDSASPPIVSYQSRPWLKKMDLAVVHRGRKWILDARGKDRALLHSYNVGDDPDELVDLGDDPAGVELLRDLRAMLETLEQPLVQGQEALPSSSVQAQLDALGYGGEAEDH